MTTLFDIYKINLIFVLKLIRKNKSWAYIFFILIFIMTSYVPIVYIAKNWDYLIFHLIAGLFIIPTILSCIFVSTSIFYFLFFIFIIKKLNGKNLFFIFYFLFFIFYFLFFIFYFLAYDHLNYYFHDPALPFSVPQDSSLIMGLRLFCYIFMFYYIFIDAYLKKKYFFAFMVSISLYVLTYKVFESIYHGDYSLVYLFELVLYIIVPTISDKDFLNQDYQDIFYLVPFIFFLLQLFVEACYVYKEKKIIWSRYNRIKKYKQSKGLKDEN